MDDLIFQRDFSRVARWAADRPATVDLGSGRRISFGEHHDRVMRLGDGITRTLGGRPHDRFSALLDNRAAYAELWHAGLCGAGIFHSINSRVGLDELLFTLRDSGSRTLFVSPAHLDLVARVRADLPDLENIVVVGDGDGGAVRTDLGYEELLQAANPSMVAAPHETDPCILMYTGGTTGLPKGVAISQRAVMLNWRKQAEALQPGPDWSFLQVVPMFHVGSLLSILGIHLAGASITVLPAWEPGPAMDVIESEQIGAIGLVAAMCVQLLNHPDFAPERLASLRYIGYGGGPMPLGLMHAMLDVLPAEARMCQSYGMTEACGMVSILNGADHRTGDELLLRSAGRPMAGCEWSIRDELGAPLPDGEPGEIWIRSDSLFDGYWNRPEETAAALREGWYHSGDVGQVDRYGYLWVVDRLSDMIVSGAENIYSIEVESAISTIPDVLRVAVFGVPHELWGEAVHAVVQVPAGSALTAEGVRAHVAKSLSRYKVPKSVTLQTDPFPTSATGKVLKRTMKQQQGQRIG